MSKLSYLDSDHMCHTYPAIVLLVLDSIAQLWSNYCCDPILVAHGTAISDKREARGGAILLPSKPEGVQFFCQSPRGCNFFAPLQGVDFLFLETILLPAIIAFIFFY